MVRTAHLLALVLASVLGASARHFDVEASFEPSRKAGAPAAVAVSFRALDPDVKVNESPAPRLKLDMAQTVLVDRQAPAPAQVPDYDPLTTRYLDTAKPVLFPVAIATTAAQTAPAAQDPRSVGMEPHADLPATRLGRRDLKHSKFQISDSKSDARDFVFTIAWCLMPIA